jgi:hydroxyacylglutathione hydrolase
LTDIKNLFSRRWKGGQTGTETERQLGIEPFATSDSLQQGSPSIQRCGKLLFIVTVHSFTFNPFQTNSYICHDAGEAVLIDPASQVSAERRQVEQYLEDYHLTVKHLLLTHAHLDHIFDCAYFAGKFGLSWQLHPSDVMLLNGAQMQAQLFGMDVETPPPPGSLLNEEDTITFGGATWQVLHAPGHSPGSVCFYDEANGFVISGDVLFAGSIGRTDLWMGSLPQLMESIHQKLLPLSDGVKVYPGHGPATTIGEERRTNPFLTTGFASIH